jgi:hypothetical protein
VNWVTYVGRNDKKSERRDRVPFASSKCTFHSGISTPRVFASIACELSCGKLPRQVLSRTTKSDRKYVRPTHQSNRKRQMAEEFSRKRETKKPARKQWVSKTRTPATRTISLAANGDSQAHCQPSLAASSLQVLWLKNQLVRLLELSDAPSWLWTRLACRPAKVGTPAPSPGVLALGPPPPRRGLAMRPKGLLAKLGWVGAAPRPRVEPCLAASRRSLTARS